MRRTDKSNPNGVIAAPNAIKHYDPNSLFSPPLGRAKREKLLSLRCHQTPITMLRVAPRRQTAPGFDRINMQELNHILGYPVKK
jgi:hypothetical protein